MKNETLDKNPKEQKKSPSKWEFSVVKYVFILLFLALIAHYVNFQLNESEDFINNDYNGREELFAERVTRGEIHSADGKVLATTVIENGEEERYYPYDYLFSHVVGYSVNGKSGIEKIANFNLLRSHVSMDEKVETELGSTKYIGDNVITTLNYELQEAAYDALSFYEGAIVVLEPSTGKILAMVSKPDYDPNTLVSDYEYIVSQEGNQSLLNKSTFGLFVPGSIFKTLTSLAYIRSDANLNNYDYLCEGQINLGGSDYITCFNQTVHGSEDLWDSFANSCNASFGNIGLKLGSDALTDTCESVFFNGELPTDIPHKNSSFQLASDASDWEIAATAIGQGKTEVTPLQMVMIASAIANGGNLMEPYLVDSIETADGNHRVKKYLPESYGQIISTQEANVLGSLMEAVVEYGTAYSLSGYGYTVAGKTGTAEVSGKGDNSWFIGYAPVEQPQIAICVLVENEQGYYESALPVANAILQNYLNR